MVGGRSWLVLCAVSLLLCPVHARYVAMCDLVRELRGNGFPEWNLSNWVCLAKVESGFNTRQIGGLSAAGRDLGIFQISDTVWCTWGNPGGGCNMRCEDLINDDVAPQARCALIISNGGGNLTPWVGWERDCYNHPLPDISYCSLAPHSIGLPHQTTKKLTLNSYLLLQIIVRKSQSPYQPDNSI